MSTLILERPATVIAVVTEIQKHLDKEAAARSMPSLAPKALCPLQKANLAADLLFLLRE